MSLYKLIFQQIDSKHLSNYMLLINEWIYSKIRTSGFL